MTRIFIKAAPFLALLSLDLAKTTTDAYPALKRPLDACMLSGLTASPAGGCMLQLSESLLTLLQDSSVASRIWPRP